ncbi:spermatogenesis-associated protein 22 isoform 1-T4 [Synchiropus picturatus]
MRRNENTSSGPTPGASMGPIFNQRRRNRLPLTSAPSENEFLTRSQFAESSSSASPYNYENTFGAFYPTAGPSSAFPQKLQWNRSCGPASTTQGRQYSSHGPLSTWRSYAPVPHPYKAGATSSTAEQPGKQRSAENKLHTNSQFIRRNLSDKSGPENAFPPVAHQLPYSRNPQQSGVSCPPQSRNNVFEKKKSPQNAQSVQPNKNQDEFPKTPSSERSLRILTAVIDGMRHWSKFKDKFSYLFEIFATLDSAVTTSHHGAKNFMIRVGKDVVQCVYYENEMALPRLIRGQVHRCVGNYDSSRDVLMCVSVRPAQPTEQKFFEDAVRVCDAEMRKLVKSIREV